MKEDIILFLNPICTVLIGLLSLQLVKTAMSNDSEVLNGLVFTRVDPSVIVHVNMAGGFGHRTYVVALSAHIQTKVYISTFMIQVF